MDLHSHFHNKSFLALLSASVGIQKHWWSYQKLSILINAFTFFVSSIHTNISRQPLRSGVKKEKGFNPCIQSKKWLEKTFGAIKGLFTIGTIVNCGIRLRRNREVELSYLSKCSNDENQRGNFFSELLSILPCVHTELSKSSILGQLLCLLTEALQCATVEEVRFVFKAKQV